MSYDLEFLEKAADQTWEEAFETAEEADTEAPAAEISAAVTAATRALLGPVTVNEGEQFYELDHEASGIQLILYRHSAAITVPYWHTGADAVTVVRQIYDLGLIVERHTGLAGYDPQTDLAVAEAATQPDLAVHIFDRTAASFTGRGIRH